jgi:transposase
MERVPDRQAVEMVKYHLGWKLALNLKLGADGFHPTTLVHFRQRLLEAGKSGMAFGVVLKALEEEGFIAKRSRQRLDSTHILGAVARMSALECVRETLAVALDELEAKSTKDQRPEFWEELWERYVESKLDLQKCRRDLAIQTPPSWRGFVGAYWSGLNRWAPRFARLKGSLCCVRSSAPTI